MDTEMGPSPREVGIQVQSESLGLQSSVDNESPSVKSSGTKAIFSLRYNQQSNSYVKTVLKTKNAAGK